MINKHLKFIGHFFGRKRRNANALEIKHGFMGGGAKSFKYNMIYCIIYVFYLKRWLNKIKKSGCPVIFIFFLIFPINSFSQSSTQNLSNVVQVSGGLLHLCALISTNGYLDENARGIVKCWGNNGDGQLGRGSTMFSGIPKEVLIDGTTNVLSNVKQISAGEYHNCAVVEKDTEDQVWCWGLNSDWSPVLGNNGNTDKSKAVKAIFSESHRFKKVVSGSYHTCAITDDGYLYCWGQDGYGCLGNSSVGSSSRVPVLSNISDVVDVALCRYNTTCALKSDTNIYCWGNGLYV